MAEQGDSYLQVPGSEAAGSRSPSSLSDNNLDARIAASTPLPTPKTAADFDFLDILGQGSFATVQLARDKETGKEYAIKILDKRHIIQNKKVKYVNLEKEVFSKLNRHPGFVKLYYTFQDTASLYFVLSYAENGELLHYIRKLGAFELKCAKWYAAEIVLALEFMHSCKVIHRDLKPENILLSADMHVKITDFGTAKILDEEESDGSRKPPAPGVDPNGNNRRSSFVGTAEYVSPELLRDKTTGLSSDLWALGCIIYQMVAGRPPFKGGSEYQTLQRVTNGEYEFPELFPEITKDLVHNLLLLDPDRRLGSPATGGYPILKAHPFFEGINWDTILTSDPPELKPYLPPPGTEGAGLTSEINKGGDGIVAHTVGMEDAVEDEFSRERGVGPECENREERLAAQVKSSIWAALVPGELILYTSPVHKCRGFFYKSRQLLLTDAPRLLLAGSNGNRVKEEIPWSEDLKPELKNSKYFFVHTPQRTYYLEDLEANASAWVNQINLLSTSSSSQPANTATPE